MPENNNNSNRRQRRTPQPVDNTYGHLQPQALDVEKTVLGALMIDKDAYSVVCEILYPESFYEPRNQKVYAAIRDLAMAYSSLVYSRGEVSRQSSFMGCGAFLG